MLSAELNEHDVTTASCEPTRCSKACVVDAEISKYRSLLCTNGVGDGSDSHGRSVPIAPVNSTVLDDLPLTETDVVKQDKQLTMVELVKKGECKVNEPDVG